MHRVVITGMGCVSALGHSAEAHWQAACEGRSGIAETTLVPPEKLKIRIAAEVKDFQPLEHFEEGRLGLLDRYAQFALLAARQAVAGSGIELAGETGARTAVVLGTGIGGSETIDSNAQRIYAEGNRRIHPMSIPRLMANAAASLITIEHGTTGPSFAVSSACSSANHAIGEAFWLVRSGRAAAAITGGSEACINYGSLLAWQALRVMDPETCRPFSRDRMGMVLGEGAAMFVLETLEAARARGAPIIAEIAGFGMSSDAESMLEPSELGAARAMAGALAEAGLSAEDIDYVNAHGTGTPANDTTETQALKRVFGSHAPHLAVSSTKSMHGHALGAAGALELVITARAVAEGVAPPTINLRQPDPACDLDYVPNAAQERPIRAALSNSFAFGGLNAVLAVRRLH